jgi:hypothetical protein
MNTLSYLLLPESYLFSGSATGTSNASQFQNLANTGGNVNNSNSNLLASLTANVPNSLTFYSSNNNMFNNSGVTGSVNNMLPSPSQLVGNSPSLNSMLNAALNMFPPNLNFLQSMTNNNTGSMGGASNFSNSIFNNLLLPPLSLNANNNNLSNPNENNNNMIKQSTQNSFSNPINQNSSVSQNLNTENNFLKQIERLLDPSTTPSICLQS